MRSHNSLGKKKKTGDHLRAENGLENIAKTIPGEMICSLTPNLRKSCEACPNRHGDILSISLNTCKIGVFSVLVFIFKTFERVLSFERYRFFKTQLAWITL